MDVDFAENQQNKVTELLAPEHRRKEWLAKSWTYERFNRSSDRPLETLDQRPLPASYPTQNNSLLMHIHHP